MPPHPNKYEIITADLLQNIRSGKLKPGDQVQPERQLAETYGVSRLTARRALCDLEERGVVERHGRRGTIVVELPDSKQAQTLTLLCSASPGTMIEEAISFTLIKAQERGWKARIIRVLQNDEKPMLDALKLGTPTIFLGWTKDISPSGKLDKAMCRASNVVIIAGMIENSDIPSVVCNDKKGIKLAISSLKKAGHSQIALVTTCADPTHPIASMQIKTWWEEMRPTMTNQDLHENLVVVGSVFAENGLVTMHRKIKTFLESTAAKKTTALICLTEELATAAIAACRSVGKTVPDDVSIMEYGWSQRSDYYNPPRSGIDTRIDEHIKVAMDLLEQIQKGKQPETLQHHVSPQYIERDSIAPPKK